MRATKTVLSLAAALSIVLVLAASLAWWSIHTSWFANLVRTRIVAVLGDMTGGRVEIQEFRFNPDTLRAGVSGLTVHGTEPAGAPPLLSIKSAEIGVKLLSIWRQDVDLESIIIHQPEISIMVKPDGTTNLPVLKRKRASKNPIERILDLKVKHLEVIQGLFRFNNQRVPFSFTSQALGLLLNYGYRGPNYGISLHSDVMKVMSGTVKPKSLLLAVQGQLYRDHAELEQLKVATVDASSTVNLSGTIQSFSHASLDGRLDADLAIDDLAQLADINRQLKNGRGQVKGPIHIDTESGKFLFDGKASAQGVDLVLPVFVLRNMSGTAGMVADNTGMLLNRAEAGAHGAHFSGGGFIKAYHFLQVDGHVSDVSLKDVGSYLTNRPFPWSGTARGTAHASARLGDKQPDFIIGAKVDISAGKTGIPTAGNVEVTYYDNKTEVAFGDSRLSLPNSTVKFKGSLNSDLAVKAESANLADLKPIIPIVGAKLADSDIPSIAAGGSGHFDGTLHDLFHKPVIQGELAMSKSQFRAYPWDSLDGQFAFSSTSLSISEFQVKESGVSLTGSANAQLANWSFGNDSPVRLNTRFQNLDIVKTAAWFTSSTLPFIQGVASGQLNMQGTVNNPQGAGNFEIKNLDAYGQQLNRIDFGARLEGDRLIVEKGRIESGPALLSYSGVYQHSPAEWSTGRVTLKADTNGFPLTSLSTVHKFVPGLNARAEVHIDLLGKLQSNSFEPLRINGSGQFQHVSVNGREIGNASVKAATQGNAMDFSYSGDLRDTKFHGTAQAQLAAGTPIHGDLQLDRISLSTVKSLASETKLTLPIDGYLDGGVTFDGLLEDPARMRARATIKDLQISSAARATVTGAPLLPDIVLRNNEPIVIDAAAGVLTVSKFEIDGRETSVKITGTAPFLGGKPIAIQAVGKADLALFSIFDPNVHSSGTSELAANIAGPINAPNITGALEIRSGSFFLADLPNGLSDVNGTVVFSRNRATIQKMSAHSGGGDISLGGSLSFGEGNPLVYHLEANARNVRVRYANSISVTANSDLRLSGTSANSILSGTLTVTRVVFTPNADAGNLLAAASSFSSGSADQGDFIAGLHLDVGVESAPNLQVSTNLSRDVEAEIQLRLRGTPDHPVVLGNITANQGDIKIFGTRFSLNRGEVSFVNTVRVEPVLDLDLETQARGVTVDITVSGTPSKLNFNYRSDPPLQPRDIIALLTVGRTPGVGSTSNAQGASDVTALSSGVNSVLGQAISPVSNRLSKLFGITNIKIDPFVQGITNTPQARLSVEQQISRDVTVTYVTNLSQTSEQIFRFEWSLNRQFSVVAIRDDNGEFGIDFQYKKRFK